MKICPTDWLEGIAMAATGGIYCQFKQAEYILEDFKAEVQRIHTTGEAERDALEAQYLAECARQSAEATDAIAKKQQALQELLDMAALCVRRAAGLSFTAERAATVRHGAGLPARARSASKVANPLKPAPDEVAAGGVLPPLGLSQQAIGAQSLLQQRKDQADAKAVGPFAAAGQELDRLTQEAAAEVRKGFDSELFAPLMAMAAGLPPPDPLTLVVAMNFSKVELLRILTAKDNWLNGIRAKHDAALAAQSEALGEQTSGLMAMLETAIKSAVQLIAALKDALDSPSQATQDALAIALSAARDEQAAPNPSATVPARGSAAQRWRQVAVSTSQVDHAFKGAIAAAQVTVPKRATPAELSALSISARSTVRDRVAKGTLAQLEADATARFGHDQKTLQAVLQWINVEATDVGREAP